MKVIHPYFYAYIFFNSTIFLPIVINGFRISDLWYAPLSDSGNQTFLYPFLEFVFTYIILSCVVGYFIFKYKKNRFVLVRGDFTIKNVIKNILKDKLIGLIFVTYAVAYFLSYLVVSGIILIPNINISPYFLPLTIISYQGSGIPVYFGFFVFNLPFLLLGLINTLVLSLGFILSYYLVSLIYVSYNIMRWEVPRSFRLTAVNMAGGFLTASVPSIGTIAGICCLTPAGINSLMYLASTSFPLLGKNIVWKNTLFIGASLLTTISQIVLLSSPVFVGVILLSISVYSLSKVSRKLREGIWLRA
mgnify:CR=1 FL=1